MDNRSSSLGGRFDKRPVRRFVGISSSVSVVSDEQASGEGEVAATCQREIELLLHVSTCRDETFSARFTSFLLSSAREFCGNFETSRREFPRFSLLRSPSPFFSFSQISNFVITPLVIIFFFSVSRPACRPFVFRSFRARVEHIYFESCVHGAGKKPLLLSILQKYKQVHAFARAHIRSRDKRIFRYVRTFWKYSPVALLAIANA